MTLRDNIAGPMFTVIPSSGVVCFRLGEHVSRQGTLSGAQLATTNCHWLCALADLGSQFYQIILSHQIICNLHPTINQSSRIPDVAIQELIVLVPRHSAYSRSSHSAHERLSHTQSQLGIPELLGHGFTCYLLGGKYAIVSRLAGEHCACASDAGD